MPDRLSADCTDLRRCLKRHRGGTPSADICVHLRTRNCPAIDSMNILRFVGLSLILCAGCGDSLQVAPVSGTITFEGKPLAGATITTQPIATESQNPGSGSFGQTDDQGRFE